MASKARLKKDIVSLWEKRITSAQKTYEEWESGSRVQECYRYWQGHQLDNEIDPVTQQRRVQINKIHPEVRNTIPSLYYYRPFARLAAQPEQANDSGTTVDTDVQILQDTVNYLIRDKNTQYRESTLLGLKESFWALGCVEVGYSADFTEAPNTIRPPLREQEQTKGVEGEAEFKKAQPTGRADLTAPAPVDPNEMMNSPTGPAPEDIDAVVSEVQQLQQQLKGERFYVKHIPSQQVLISDSDKAVLYNNDWVGYWEDQPIEDVKKAPAYENTEDLEPHTIDDEKQEKQNNENVGAIDKVRLYKIWDIRTGTRYVFAKGHDAPLLEKPFRRCPLKFLRFDIDPYHFYPRPLILSKLDVQDEYNRSRQFLSDVRDGIVPRYTYDSDAVSADDMKKLESGKMGTYVPRKPGTVNPIEAVQQPGYSENALQTLTLSDKEFQDVGGVGGDSQIPQSKTATQAKIADVKNQAQDNWDRIVVSEWLGDVAQELLTLAIENMSIDTWVAINVVPDGMMASQLSQQVAQTFQRVNAEMLGDSAKGLTWSVQIDVESLSPVTEEEQFQKWMQGLTLFANPVIARMFAVSPPMLKRTLTLLGMRSATDQDMIAQAMMQIVQMEQQLAAQGQNAAPGVSPQPGGGAPGAPKPPAAAPPPGPAGPKAPGPPPGGPQPGPPQGPGASGPKMGSM